MLKIAKTGLRSSLHGCQAAEDETSQGKDETSQRQDATSQHPVPEDSRRPRSAADLGSGPALAGWLMFFASARSARVQCHLLGREVGMFHRSADMVHPSLGAFDFREAGMSESKRLSKKVSVTPAACGTPAPPCQERFFSSTCYD